MQHIVRYVAPGWSLRDMIITGIFWETPWDLMTVGETPDSEMYLK